MQIPSRFAIQMDTLERTLVPSSLAYLALPYAIFCLGWLHWYWALLGIGLLTLAFIESTRLTFGLTPTTTSHEQASTPDPAPFFTWQHAILLLLLSLAWLGLSGAGGIGYQVGDWIKHESVLKDLIDKPWPVIYEFFQAPLPLVYYIAFYLPAALAGKLGGWQVAQVALFLWAWLGLLLSLLWFWLLVRRSSRWIFLLFVLFSGLDLVGKLFGSLVGWTSLDGGRLEKWSQVLEYSANTTLLYWVPNQALGGWIACGLTLYLILKMRERRVSLLPFGLSALWSPFATIGLIPYLIVEFLNAGEPLGMRLRRYFSWSNLCGVIFLLMVGLFYLSKSYAMSPMLQAQIPRGFFLASYPGSTLGGLALIAAFWLTEVGIYGYFVWRGQRALTAISEGGAGPEARLWRWFLAATLIYLALLPFYNLGIFNDLVMRASIPALFCLAVLVGRTLTQPALGTVTRGALVVALALGATTNVMEVESHIAGLYQRAMGAQPTDAERMRGIVEVFQGTPRLLLQYVGSYSSPFFADLAKGEDWVHTLTPKDYIAFNHNTILYESYQASQESGLSPGDTVQIVSKMHVFFGAITTDYNIALHLVDEHGAEVWKDQGWPQNRPTSIWAPSVEWFDTRTLTIPTGTPAGIYRLDLSFVDPATQDLLPATDLRSGKALGSMVPVGYLIVGSYGTLPYYLLPKPAQLGDDIQLLGTISRPNPTISAGESLSVELAWQATGEMDVNYTGFVHLVGPDQKLVAQNDHQPRDGFLPTDIWQNGLIVADLYRLDVPQEAPPGKYTLVAGMYDLDTGKRLPVSENGEQVGDAVVLTSVYVQ